MIYTVHAILQARVLEWVAFPFSRGSSQPRDWTCVFCIAGRFFIVPEPPDYEWAHLKNHHWGFPASPVVKNLSCNVGNIIQSFVKEDPTCHGATKPVCHNYWDCALELASCNYWSLSTLEPVFYNKRSHLNENPTHHNYRVAPTLRKQRKPMCSNEDPEQSKNKTKHKSIIAEKPNLNVGE